MVAVVMADSLSAGAASSLVTHAMDRLESSMITTNNIFFILSCESLSKRSGYLVSRRFEQHDKRLSRALILRLRQVGAVIETLPLIQDHHRKCQACSFSTLLAVCLRQIPVDQAVLQSPASLALSDQSDPVLQRSH